MAKISAYPDGGSPQNSDNFIVARAGRNFKLLWSSIVSGLQTTLTIIESMFSFSDITTANSSTTKHGLLPKLSGEAGQYLGGDGNWYDLPIVLNLFLDNTASSIAGYKTLTQTRPVAAETNVSASIPAANTVIEEFAAAADQFAFISASVLHIHVHLAKTAGVKTATASVSVYHRTSGGTETLLGSSAQTGNLSGSSTPYDLDVSVPDTAFASTDRLVIKFFGTPGGAGTDPTVAVYFQGSTDSRIEIGTSPSLSGYAPLASPAFTGVPTAPTAAQGTNTTQVATQAAVIQEKLAFATSGTDVWRVGTSPGGVSAFSGTIASIAADRLSLTYNVVSGQEGAMVVISTSQLAKMRLYNTTRGNYALISQNVVATNTTTLTAAAPANWQVGDTINITSQLPGGGAGYVDLEVTSVVNGRSGLILSIWIASVNVNDAFWVVDAAGGFAGYIAESVASALVNSIAFVTPQSSAFSVQWNGSPTTLIIRLLGYLP